MNRRGFLKAFSLATGAAVAFSVGIKEPEKHFFTDHKGNEIQIGDIFTIQDVYEVNPETKKQEKWLKQFVVTSNKNGNIEHHPIL